VQQPENPTSAYHVNTSICSLLLSTVTQQMICLFFNHKIFLSSSLQLLRISVYFSSQSRRRMLTMADYPDMTRFPCANIEQIGDGGGSPCLQPAPNVCKGCFLVQVSSHMSLSCVSNPSSFLLTSLLNIVLQQRVPVGSLESSQG
jgi:hypothetical protein